MFEANNVIPACDSVSCTLSDVGASHWYSLKSSLVLPRCSLQFIRIFNLKAELLQHLQQLRKIAQVNIFIAVDNFLHGSISCEVVATLSFF